MRRRTATQDRLRLETERPLLPVLSALPLVLVLPVVALTATAQGWMVVALLIAAASVYGAPDSTRGAFGIGLTAAVWVLAGPDSVSWGSLVVALLLLTSHSVLALRSTAPPTVEFGEDIVRRWLQRAGGVAAVTAGVWLAALGVDRLARTLTAAGVAVGLLLVGGLALLLRLETVRGSEDRGR